MQRDPARALRAGRPRDALGRRGSGAAQPRRRPGGSRRRPLPRPQRAHRHGRAGRAGELALRLALEPRGAGRTPLRPRLDRHERLRRRDVDGRPGAGRREHPAGGGAAAALGRRRGDDGARRSARPRVIGRGSVPTARSSPSRPRSRVRSPSRPSPPAPGSCGSSSRASRRTAGTARWPSGPAGRATRSASTRSRRRSTSSAGSSGSRSSGGSHKRHPHFSPGFFTSARTSCYADAGVPFPAYFPHRAAIEYVIWYPPQESAEEIAREIEEHVLAGCRQDTWLRDHPPDVRVAQPLAAHGAALGASSSCRRLARGHEAASGERVGPPSPSTRSTSAPPATARSTRTRASPPSSTGRATSSSRTAGTSTCELDEVATAAKALAATVVDWCGPAS